MRVKLIAAGAGLIGYGAFLGWAVTADFYERKMKSNQKLLGDIISRQSRELQSLNDLILTYPTDEEEIGGYGDDQPRIVAAEVEVEEDPEGEEYDEEKTQQLRSNLQSVINQYTGGDEQETESLVEASVRSAVDKTPPFVISRDQFAWDDEGEADEYDKLTLKYYPRERILLDDDDDIIEDVASVIGWRSLNRFGDESGDADVVFVRNHRMRTDFEVVQYPEDVPPAHVRYGMGKEEFETNRAAGLIKFRPGEM